MIAILHGLLNQSSLWPLLAAFVVVAMESSAFLGLFFPGETAALAVGALAGAGLFGFWSVFSAIAAGAIAGDIGGYALGRWKGDRLLAGWAFARRQHERHREQLESYFARWGSATVLIGRFVAVGRAFVPFTAGLYQMRGRRFIPMAVIAGALWALVMVTLGYLLGSHWRLVEAGLSSLGLGILILFILTAGAIVTWRWLLKHQDEVRAAWQRHITQRYGLELESVLGFIRERFSPTGYLGLHLTVGLAVMVALAWLFGGVVQDIFAQDPLVRVDRAVAMIVAAHRSGVFDAMAAVPAFLSGVGPMAAVATLTAAGLAYAGEKALALAALPIFGSAYGLGVALRGLFSLFSPMVAAARVVHGFHDFPSIAMLVATSVYGFAGYALATHGRRWRLQTLGAVVALYVVLMIAIGAVYRGELLSAVIGGFAAGGCWLAICVTGILTYQKLRS